MLNEPQSQSKTLSRISFWDRLGITLSAVCLIHCVATPVLLLSLPLFSQALLTSTWFHVLLAILIVPVGVFAFLRGYRHHRQKFILSLGLPGLVLVALVPLAFDLMGIEQYAPVLVSIGSILLVTAHWKNQRACSCETHHH